MMKQMIVVGPRNYNETVIDFVANLSKKPGRIGYVSLNKTYSSVMCMLEDRGADMGKFFFIDCITSSLLPAKGVKNVAVVMPMGSIDALNLLKNEIKAAVSREKLDTLVIDSFSSLMVYMKEEKALSWLTSLLNFLEEGGIGVTIFVLEDDTKRDAVKQVEMRVDSADIIKY
ncbi:MAG: hypothetical protein HY367_01650 [Candidatus Aenigmarchaeota archaeon]|nr:hypothetical protein [Candidatus Aenigmarchaeota archaeon]